MRKHKLLIEIMLFDSVLVLHAFDPNLAKTVPPRAQQRIMEKAGGGKGDLKIREDVRIHPSCSN
jgi:hypothetical protein